MKQLFVLSSLLLIIFSPTAESCSCQYQHPQAHFCHSDFVILARIRRSKMVNMFEQAYKVRIRKEYKLSDKARVALKSGLLHSAVEESMCGVHLREGEIYAIAGSIHSLKAHVTSCDMVIPWRNLTRRQRKGMKMLYQHGCECFPKWGEQSCPLVFPDKCHVKEGICMKQRSGRCDWTRNRALRTCLKEVEKPRRKTHTISLWSG